MDSKNKEAIDVPKILKALHLCKVCHLAMIDDQKPYVIPLNYAYEWVDGALTLFFHSAKKGQKMDILRRNNKVCFEMTNLGTAICDNLSPCNSGYYFSSVQGFGDVFFVVDVDEKCRALSLIMKQQFNAEVDFCPKQAEAVCIYKVTTADLSYREK